MGLAVTFRRAEPSHNGDGLYVEKHRSQLRGLTLFAVAQHLAEDILQCGEEQSEETNPNKKVN